MWKYVAFSVLILCSFGTNGQDSEIDNNSTTSEQTTSVALNTTTMVTTLAPVETTTNIDTSTPVPTTTPESTTERTKTSVVTPTPTEMPNPEVGNWTVEDKNGTTCIRANMAVQFLIHTVDPPVIINLFPNASSAGSDCHPMDNVTQQLVLSEANLFTLTLTFAKDDKQAYVRNISFVFTTEGEKEEMSTSGKFFPVAKDKSYRCNIKQTVKVENVTLSMSSVHLQAFGEKGKTDFSLPQECSADDNLSDIVPIAVGCALAALVVIVLIAYLVGRRQSRQKGYQSV